MLAFVYKLYSRYMCTSCLMMYLAIILNMSRALPDEPKILDNPVLKDTGTKHKKSPAQVCVSVMA